MCPCVGVFHCYLVMRFFFCASTASAAALSTAPPSHSVMRLSSAVRAESFLPPPALPPEV